MVAEASAKTIRVTPEMRLVQVLDEADETPLLLDRGGTLFRLSKETEDRGEQASAPVEGMPEQTIEERVAIVERMIQRRDAIFAERPLPDDSTEILRRQREERSRHVAGL